METALLIWSCFLTDHASATRTRLRLPCSSAMAAAVSDPRSARPIPCPDATVRWMWRLAVLPVRLPAILSSPACGAARSSSSSGTEQRATAPPLSPFLPPKIANRQGSVASRSLISWEEAEATSSSAMVRLGPLPCFSANEFMAGQLRDFCRGRSLFRQPNLEANAALHNLPLRELRLRQHLLEVLPRIRARHQEVAEG